jgi:hypothetical protein
MFGSIDTNTKQQSKHTTRLYLFKKLPELDPDLVVKYPDPAKRSGSDRIRIRNTGQKAAPWYVNVGSGKKVRLRPDSDPSGSATPAKRLPLGMLMWAAS